MRAAAGAQQCERSVGKAAVRERQREPSRVITAEAMGESGSRQRQRGNGSAWQWERVAAEGEQALQFKNLRALRHTIHATD